MIKILAGWSNPGGSSESFINLCNSLNESGHKCIFYGPHRFHLGQCPSNTIDKFTFNLEDIVIVHFLHLPRRLEVKRFILSSHEQDIFDLNKINTKIYDKIHYVSEHQRNYHNINHPYFICPNILDSRLKNIPKNDSVKKIFGIIGSIDENKQTHKSIQRALNDGAEKIFLYGTPNETTSYFINYVEPLINKYPEKILIKGIEFNKNKMYASVSRVYQDSIRETWGYIKAECQITGTEFYGNDSTKEMKIIRKEEILSIWLKELYA